MSIHSFSKYLLQAYRVLGSLLVAGDISANETKILALVDIFFFFLAVPRGTRDLSSPTRD